MKPTADTSKASLTIQGMEFTSYTPYSAGYVLTEAEASVLNQTRLENVRNNFAAQIKKAKDEYRKANSLGEDAEVSNDQLDMEKLSAAFEELDANYEFGIRRVGGGPALSPEEREARKIARELITAQLKAQNYAIKSLPEGWMEENVAAVAQDENVRKEAKKRLASVQKIAISTLSLPGAQSAEAATQEPSA